MAVVDKKELLDFIQARFREDTSDEVLAFIENFSDTVNDTTDWKQKYDENDAEWKAKYEANDSEWRQKYKDRFFSDSIIVTEAEVSTPVDVEETIPDAPTSYEDLFKEVE